MLPPSYHHTGCAATRKLGHTKYGYTLLVFRTTVWVCIVRVYRVMISRFVVCMLMVYRGRSRRAQVSWQMVYRAKVRMARVRIVKFSSVQPHIYF